MAYHTRHIGPDQRHPVTGVKLNDITVKRKSLDFDAAVTAWVMYLQGAHYTDVVHLLGTTAYRVGEVFRGEVHQNSKGEALYILTR